MNITFNRCYHALRHDFGHVLELIHRSDVSRHLFFQLSQSDWNARSTKMIFVGGWFGSETFSGNQSRRKHRMAVHDLTDLFFQVIFYGIEFLRRENDFRTFQSKKILQWSQFTYFLLLGSDKWANENKIFIIGLFRVNLNTRAMKPRIGDLAIYPSDGSAFIDTVFFANGATLGLLALCFRATLCHGPSLTLHTLRHWFDFGVIYDVVPEPGLFSI